MARTTISVFTPVGSRPTLPLTANSMDVTFTAADVANGNQAAFGSFSQLLVIARNDDVGAVTVTFTSAADPFNRTGDISAYAMATTEHAVNVFGIVGWRQSDGYLYFSASDADVKFCVIGL